MKINKVMSLVLIGCLASTMLVGCSKKSNDNEANSKIENALKNTFGDKGEVKEGTTKEDKKDEVKEDKDKEVPKENKKSDSKKQTSKDNKKETTNDNTKKDNKTNVKKDTETKETTKEKPVYNEYGYDQYGNYNPNKDLHNDREWSDEDYERWEDIYGDDVEDYGEEEPGFIKDGTGLGEKEWNQDMDTTDDDGEDING